MTTLAAIPITTAVTAQTTSPITVGPYQAPNSGNLQLQATFTYGSGGTAVTSWIQTSLDGGLTWIDIASFAFTTSSAKFVYSLFNSPTALQAATQYTPTDGTLANNTAINGIFGPQLRVKYTTTGTYAGGTTLNIYSYPP
jgi:hypothetical protein